MLSLLLAASAALLVLYLPGVFFFRATGFSWLLAAICAPIYSLCAYAVLPMLYYPLGIPCGVATVLVPTLSVALVMWAALARRRASQPARIDIARCREIEVLGRSLPFEPVMLACYIAIAVALCAFVVGTGARAVEGFLCNWDNQTHLNLIRSFLDSGKWSSLDASTYLTAAPNAIPFTSTGGFYPSAFHDLVALSCSITGIQLVTAYNGVVAVILIAMYPSCMFLFFAALFPKSRMTVAAGAIVFMAFGVFPWVPVFYMGPVIPFLIATTAAFAIMAVVFAFIQSEDRKPALPVFVAFCCVSAACLALTQTSALFTIYVFLGAYACHFLAERIDASERVPADKKLAVKVAGIAGLVTLLALFLVLCYHLPFLKGVVNYSSRKYRPLDNVIVRLASLALSLGKPQVLLAAVSAVGVVRCVKTRNVWMLAPVVYMALAFIGVSTQSGPLHSLDKLAGFWYNNYHRVTMHFALYLMPIAAMGLSSVIGWAMRKLRSSTGKPAGEATAAMAGGAFSVALVAVLAVSGGAMNTAIRNHAHNGITLKEDRVYAESETRFVDRVKDVIPEGALVLNAPYDGSVYSYGVNGLNTYFRKEEREKMTDDAKLISRSLADYASDDAVRQAVGRTGAEYVLILDQGVSYEDGVWITKQSKKMYEAWQGISSITDDTPGFEVVLAQDDMRLYRMT